MIHAEVVVVTCGCGLLPLDKAMHATSTTAWQAAADHVALNPTKCHPTMHRDTVPAWLHPNVTFTGAPAATPMAVAA